jgi:hypothetical protein
MQTLKTSTTDALANTDPRRLPASLSAGWVIRRASLWLLFVGLGVAGSCLLYMAASRAEGESQVPPAAARISAKI